MKQTLADNAKGGSAIAQGDSKATQRNRTPKPCRDTQEALKALASHPTANKPGPNLIGSTLTLAAKAQPITGADKINGGLTHKQDTFAKCLAQGMTQSDAYRAAYDTKGMQPSTIHASASTLAADQRIVGRVRVHQAMLEPTSQHDPLRLRVLVLNTLIEIAVDTANKPADRTRASELLGKVRGVDLFKDATQGDTSERLKGLTDLEAKLKQFIDSRTPQPIEALGPFASSPEAEPKTAENPEGDSLSEGYPPEGPPAEPS